MDINKNKNKMIENSLLNKLASSNVILPFIVILIFISVALFIKGSKKEEISFNEINNENIYRALYMNNDSSKIDLSDFRFNKEI